MSKSSCASVLILGALLFSSAAHAEGLTQDSLSDANYSPRTKPWVALQASFSTSGLGSSALRSSVMPLSAQMLPVQLQIDVQPIQSIGVLSLGPSLEYQAQLPAAAKNAPSSSLLLAWAAGAQVRYQARYTDLQPVIPTVAYELQSWTYKTAISTPGQFLASGPSAGIWLNLGWIDRRTSRVGAEELGIQHTYLTLDWKRTEGADSRISLSGDSYHIGLRLEI